MGNNPSVAKFRTNMLDLVNRAKQNFHQTLLLQAEELAGNIRSAAPVRTGNLRKSVRTKDVSSADGTKLSVLVLAGGPLTIKYEKSGPHNYSLDVEFGDRNHPPEPFFYSTARLYQQRGLEQFKETLAQTLAENQKVRDLSNQNYNSVSETQVRFGITLASQTIISYGGRGGAIALQGLPINSDKPYKPPFGGL